MVLLCQLLLYNVTSILYHRGNQSHAVCSIEHATSGTSTLYFCVFPLHFLTSKQLTQFTEGIVPTTLDHGIHN